MISVTVANQSQVPRKQSTSGTLFVRAMTAFSVIACLMLVIVWMAIDNVPQNKPIHSGKLKTELPLSARPPSTTQTSLPSSTPQSPAAIQDSVQSSKPQVPQETVEQAMATHDLHQASVNPASQPQHVTTTTLSQAEAVVAEKLAQTEAVVAEKEPKQTVQRISKETIEAFKKFYEEMTKVPSVPQHEPPPPQVCSHENFSFYLSRGGGQVVVDESWTIYCLPIFTAAHVHQAILGTSSAPRNMFYLKPTGKVYNNVPEYTLQNVELESMTVADYEKAMSALEKYHNVEKMIFGS